MSQYDQTKLLTLLEDLERAGTYSHEDDNAGEPCCPSCGKCTGHDEACELAEAIADLRAARTDYPRPEDVIELVAKTIEDERCGAMSPNSALIDRKATVRMIREITWAGQDSANPRVK